MKHVNSKNEEQGETPGERSFRMVEYRKKINMNKFFKGLNQRIYRMIKIRYYPRRASRWENYPHVTSSDKKHVIKFKMLSIIKGQTLLKGEIATVSEDIMHVFESYIRKKCEGEA